MNPTLLRRTQLLPGESLVSLLERLTQLNYYPSARLLSAICRDLLEEPADQDDLALPKWAETFLKLADLTHLSPESLYAASNHRFAPYLALPRQPPVEIPWIGGETKAMLTPNLAWERLRSVSAAQYCPHCLKTSDYHRLSWIPTAAAICLEHRCLLVSQCPGCHKRLSIQEIVRQACRGCQADLCAMETISVEGDELGLRSQQLIQSWLAVADVTGQPGEDGLPTQPPAVLYHLLENLARRLLNGWKEWSFLPSPLDGLAEHIAAPVHRMQTMTPEGIFRLHKAAFTGLRDWPNGLFRFLDAYCCGSPDPGKRLLPFRRDWFQPAWSDSDYQFVLQGFISYLLDRRIPLPVSWVEHYQTVPWFVEQTGLWSAERTAQVLAISMLKLMNSLSYGSLASCRWPPSRANVPLFERDKVLALKHKWTLGWTVSEAGSWLGLCERDVIALVKRGVLAITGHPNEDQAHWLLSRLSVEDFFVEVAARLVLYRGDRRDLLPLSEAASYTACLGMDCVTLLQGVADGFLPAYKRDPEVPSLGFTCFIEKSVWHLPDLCYTRHGWVSGHTFAQEKGFSHHLVFEWVEAGLIQPVQVFGHTRYFLRRDLERLAAQYTPGLSQSQYL